MVAFSDNQELGRDGCHCRYLTVVKGKKKADRLKVLNHYQCYSNHRIFFLSLYSVLNKKINVEGEGIAEGDAVIRP